MDETKDIREAEEEISRGVEPGTKLVEAGVSTQIGKTSQAQVRVFIQSFARKAKALQRLIVARMQVSFMTDKSRCVMQGITILY